MYPKAFLKYFILICLKCQEIVKWTITKNIKQIAIFFFIYNEQRIMIHFHWSFVSHNDLTIHFRERWELYSFLYKLLPVSQSINCVDFQVEQIKSCNSGSCNSSGNNIVMNHILCAFLLHRFPIALCILRLQFVFFLSSIFCITFSLQRSFSNKFINQTIA